MLKYTLFLSILLATLKLAGLIVITWFYVLLPVLITLALMLVILAIGGIVLLIAHYANA